MLKIPWWMWLILKMRRLMSSSVDMLLAMTAFLCGPCELGLMVTVCDGFEGLHQPGSRVDLVFGRGRGHSILIASVLTGEGGMESMWPTFDMALKDAPEDHEPSLISAQLNEWSYRQEVDSNQEQVV